MNIIQNIVLTLESLCRILQWLQKYTGSSYLGRSIMLNIPSAFLVCLLPSAGPAITPPPLFLSTTTPVFGPAAPWGFFSILFACCHLTPTFELPRANFNGEEVISSPTTHNLASKLHKRSVFWLAPTIKCTWWLARSNAMGVVKSFKRSHYNQEVISFQNYYLQLKFTDSPPSILWVKS